MSPQKDPITVDIFFSDGSKEEPDLEDNSRVDVFVEDCAYPTARVEDGDYIAWWFNADAPPVSSPEVHKWVKASTRFLAAATLHEVLENPLAFSSERSTS